MVARLTIFSFFFSSSFESPRSKVSLMQKWLCSAWEI